MSPEEQKAQQLVEFCRKFIEEQSITCAETVYQTDRVGENSFAFIEGVCEIVGYAASDGDQED
jgi:hypothetical protein